MPRYKIIAPDGREVTIEGASPPTEVEAAEIFRTLPAKPVQPAPREVVVATDGSFAALDPLLYEAGLGGLASTNRIDDKVAGAIVDIGMEGGGAAAGQALGAMTGPAAPVLIPVGGAIGGGLGNFGAQKRRILAGEQKSIRPGELLSSIFTSAIPGAPLGASGGRAIVREGGKQAAAGLAGKNLQTLVDEGRMATPVEGALSTVIPAAGGAAAQKIQAANPAISSAVAEAASEAGAGATRRNTLLAGQREGYVVPPSTVNPSFVNKRLESIAGKAAVGQQASIDNQQVTNRLAKQALGVPENVDITETVLTDIRKASAKPYEEISAMAGRAKSDLEAALKKTEGMSAHETGADIEALKKARNTATGKFRQYERSADPDHLAQARSAAETAETLEDRIEKAAAEFGSPELLTQLRDARTRIAKTYDVERALNLGTSDVSAPIVGRALDKGKPLTEELETIGRFAEAFPSTVREGARIPTPGVSKVEAGLALLSGLGGIGATGSPYGALAGLIPLASGPARSLVLSAPYQRTMAQVPSPQIDATPDAIAAAVRLLTQAAGSNEEAAKLFSAPAESMSPTTRLSRP